MHSGIGIPNRDEQLDLPSGVRQSDAGREVMQRASWRVRR